MSESTKVVELKAGVANADPTKKRLYEIGEIPPLGHVPKNMYGWAIRRDRHGEPEKAMHCLLYTSPTPRDVEDSSVAGLAR